MIDRNGNNAPITAEVDVSHENFIRNEAATLLMMENQKIQKASFDSPEYLEQLRNCGEIFSSFDDDKFDDGCSSFKKKIKRMMDISNGHGLLYKKTIEEGFGPVIPDNALAIFDYLFFYEDADEPFDSTIILGRPQRQRIHSQVMVEGLDAALATMRKGERSVYIIDSSLMFGTMGSLPRVPRDADVFAVIKLINFIERHLINEYFDLNEEERALLPWQNHYDVAVQTRIDGNCMFQERKYIQAANKYLMATEILGNAVVENEDQQHSMEEQLKLLELNLAQTNLLLDRPRVTVTYCDKVLKKDPTNVKALYRKAKALTKVGDCSESRLILLNILKLDPENLDAQKALEINEKKRHSMNMAQRDLCRRMFCNGSASEMPVEKKSKVVILSKQMLKMEENLKEFAESPDTGPSINLPRECFEDDQMEMVTEMAKRLHLKLVITDDVIKFNKH